MPCRYRLAWQSLHCVWPQLLSWPNPGPDSLADSSAWSADLPHHCTHPPDWALAWPQLPSLDLLACITPPLQGCTLTGKDPRIYQPCRCAPLSLLLPGTARGLALQPHGFPSELWPQLIPYNMQSLTGSCHKSNVAQESSFHPLLFSQGFTFLHIIRKEEECSCCKQGCQILYSPKLPLHWGLELKNLSIADCCLE